MSEPLARGAILYRCVSGEMRRYRFLRESIVNMHKFDNNEPERYWVVVRVEPGVSPVTSEVFRAGMLYSSEEAARNYPASI